MKFKTKTWDEIKETLIEKKLYRMYDDWTDEKVIADKILQGEKYTPDPDEIDDHWREAFPNSWIHTSYHSRFSSFNFPEEWVFGLEYKLDKVLKDE